MVSLHIPYSHFLIVTGFDRFILLFECRCFILLHLELCEIWVSLITLFRFFPGFLDSFDKWLLCRSVFFYLAVFSLIILLLRVFFHPFRALWLIHEARSGSKAYLFFPWLCSVFFCLFLFPFSVHGCCKVGISNPLDIGNVRDNWFLIMVST